MQFLRRRPPFQPSGPRSAKFFDAVPPAIDPAARRAQLKDAARRRTPIIEAARFRACVKPHAGPVLRANSGSRFLHILVEETRRFAGEFGESFDILGERRIIREVRIEPERNVVRRRTLLQATGSAAFAVCEDGKSVGTLTAPAQRIAVHGFFMQLISESEVANEVQGLILDNSSAVRIIFLIAGSPLGDPEDSGEFFERGRNHPSG